MNTQSTFKSERILFSVCTALICIGIIFITIGSIPKSNLTFSVDTLKANIEYDLERIRNFFVSDVEDDSDGKNEHLEEIKALSGAAEVERVLYVLGSSDNMTWILNTREKELYDIAYPFKLDHINFDEYTIVKDAHDLVCEKATYGNHLLGHIQYNDDSQHPYGALCLDEGAVCGAYARAMIFLCEAAGVEASLIKGYSNDEPHGWVLVKIGNNYYHSDPCWDDEESGISYDYFLLSDKEMEETRTWKQELYPSCPESFDFTYYN